MKNTTVYSGDVPDLVLPDHLANWDVHDYWERERFDSMAAHLTKADTLWVIGAEHGYMAALWSRLVGETVLVEPSPEFWPNIRMTWEHNKLNEPLASVKGLVADVPSGDVAVCHRSWPADAEGEIECPAQAYRYLHNPGDLATIGAVTLDQLTANLGVPAAISMDIEGGEVLALRGGLDLFTNNDVQLWVSVHPDLIERDYGKTADDVHGFMSGLGYVAEHLATDHEEHFYYSRAA